MCCTSTRYSVPSSCFAPYPFRLALDGSGERESERDRARRLRRLFPNPQCVFGQAKSNAKKENVNVIEQERRASNHARTPLGGQTEYRVAGKIDKGKETKKRGLAPHTWNYSEEEEGKKDGDPDEKGMPSVR